MIRSSYMTFRKSVWSIFFPFLIAFSFFGCEGETDRREIVLEEIATEKELQQISESKETDLLYFGFDLRASPQEDARQYLPFLKYLESTTGLRFELRFTPKNSTIVDDLGRGIIQFAAVGAGSYLLAHEKYEIISLVRGLNSQGKAEYQSCIVVSPESNIQNIEELQGKFIAFGSKSSTQGYLIPRIALFENNVTLEDLDGYKFAGSHRNCAEEVISGRVDACGIQDTMANNLSRQGLLKILYTSKYYPSSGIAANKDVQPEIIEKVKKALLDFQPTGRDAEGLYSWGKTEMPNGFVESLDANYDELRYWARKFDYLTEMDQ